MRYLAIVTVIALGLLAIGFVVTQSAPAEQFSYTGTLEQGDETYEETGEYLDTYSMNLKAGQYVDIYVTSEDFDTYLVLMPPEGEEVHIDDYYTGDENAGLLFVARETGTYQLIVTSSTPGETGDYEFRYETYDSVAEKTYEDELAEGDDVSWKGGEYFDRYELKLEPNEKRVVAMDSEDFEVYLTMHWPDGYVDFVYGEPAATLIEADENGGTYTLIATSQEPGEVGDYRLEIRTLTAEE